MALLAAAVPAGAKELGCDVAVIGASTGGCAAALAAARNGMRVILTEETDWIGGQLTPQAVPPDEHPWIEQFGATRSYRELSPSESATITASNYPLTAEARARWNLNPGNGWVSRLCHEPRVSLSRARSHARALRERRPHRDPAASTNPSVGASRGDRVESVRLRTCERRRARRRGAPTSSTPPKPATCCQ